MRAASPALLAFLEARTPCFVADLFTFTLLGGTVLRWGTFNRPIPYGGQTWSGPNGPKISCNRLSITNTSEVPELEMKLLSGPNNTIGGRAIKASILNGLFDGATVEMDTLVMPISTDHTVPPDVSLGIVLMFIGRFSTADFTGADMTLTAKGQNVLMNQYAPNNVYQTQCLHTFCDAGCTLNPATFTINGVVGAGTTSTNIVWGSIPADPTLYTLGKITITSGVANGQVRSVKLGANSGITPSYAFEDLPATGDTFKILQGCDRSTARCNTFLNSDNFRGFPYVPIAELAI
jgi:uncharacterized phage protein (TIGR02218 family)